MLKIEWQLEHSSSWKIASLKPWDTRERMKGTQDKNKDEITNHQLLQVLKKKETTQQEIQEKP